MKIILYITILTLVLFAPVRGLEVAHLEPVEVVLLCVEGEHVCIKTDTGATGSGETLFAALQDMEQTTPGVIYLDTAEYLLVQPAALNHVDAIRGYLRGSVKVCAVENADIKIADKYLETHGKLPLLRSWKSQEKLPFWNGDKIS